MQVMYQSTRGKGEPVTASQAILKGLSEDGGLFVPTQIPALDVSMDELSRMTYQETAYQVMSRLLTDFTEEELRTCINRAYDKKFDRRDGVANGVAVMRVRAGIHDDRVTVLTGRMDAVDERALGVGLEYRAVHAEPLAFLDDLGIDGGEGVRAVDARLAHARQIEVGSVDE